MQISAHGTISSAPGAAFGLALDIKAIITRVAGLREASALPPGSIVGDLHGGLTFTDAVAATLERRSVAGWQEVCTPSGDVWTVIILNR